MSSLKQEQEEGLGLRKRKRNRKSAHREDEDDGFINDGDAYKKFNSEKRKKAEDSEESSKRHKKSSKYDIDPSLFASKPDKYAKFKYDKGDKIKHKENQSVKKSTKSASGCAMSFEELMKVAEKKQKDPIPIINPLKEILEKKEKPKVDESRPLTAKEKKEIEEERLRKLRKMGKLPPKEESSKLENHKKDSISNNKIDQPPKKVPKEEKVVPEAPPKKNLDKARFFALPKRNVNNTPKDVKTTIENKPEKFSGLQDKNKPSKGTVLKDTKKHSVSKPAIKQKPPPPPQSFKRIDSDEEDYDSEMDDFIDDGDAELDYSNEIAKLFKYDKSKYVDDDDDLDDMEASYSQLQKEEKISAKIGLMEDLEDIRREEEEKKRKKMLLKKKK